MLVILDVDVVASELQMPGKTMTYIYIYFFRMQASFF